LWSLLLFFWSGNQERGNASAVIKDKTDVFMVLSLTSIENVDPALTGQALNSLIFFLSSHPARPHPLTMSTRISFGRELWVAWSFY